MNSVFFDHATIDAWIAEDAPLLDLTTLLLAIGGNSINLAGFAACPDSTVRVYSDAFRVVEPVGENGRFC